jgi:hypothetical protein
LIRNNNSFAPKNLLPNPADNRNKPGFKRPVTSSTLPPAVQDYQSFDNNYNGYGEV